MPVSIRMDHDVDEIRIIEAIVFCPINNAAFAVGQLAVFQGPTHARNASRSDAGGATSISEWIRKERYLWDRTLVAVSLNPIFSWSEAAKFDGLQIIPSGDQMSQVIAFINFKGGVGKTANAVNLGACLATAHNKKVLIVDLDSQCNATFWFLPPKNWRNRIDDRTRTVCQIFHDQINGTKKFSFANAIIRGVPISETGLQLNPKLDLLPGSIELMEVEDLLHEQSKSPFFSFLRAALAPLRREYDYILLDCPPNFFSVTKNALFFADSYILPYLPDYLSLSGINVFSRLLRKFQESVATHDPRMRGSRIRAIVVNRFRSIGNIYTQAITELKTQLAFLRKDGLVDPGAAILLPYVRDCTVVARCADEHLPIIHLKPDAIGAQDYQVLASNFVFFFSRYEPK
jgi:chromosome partitioning protein